MNKTQAALICFLIGIASSCAALGLGGGDEPTGGGGEPCIKVVGESYKHPGGHCKVGDLFLTVSKKCTQQASKCSSFTDSTPAPAEE